VLTVTEMSQEEVERALSADALDVGLAFSDVLAQDVEWLPLHREWLSLIVGQEHRRHWESGTHSAALAAESLARLGPAFCDASNGGISAATAFSLMWRWKPIRSPPSWRSSVSPS